MKKNKTCEISHIVRLEVTPEIYKQKQNTLFISGCVEHRMFKVPWARLWVYSAECSGVCTARRFETHGSDGRTARTSDRTIECMC